MFSLQFWIGVLFIIDLFIILFFLIFVNRLARQRLAEQQAAGGKNPGGSAYDNIEAHQKAVNSAADIIEMLEPLVRESRDAADAFEKQISEKKALIKELNESLDSRIISINLLLSRSESLLRDLKDKNTAAVSENAFQGRAAPPPENVFDQQNSIIDLYSRGFDADTIAARLSIPTGEVRLVIDLKEKFMAMGLKE